MRSDRPPKREIIDHVGHDRIRVGTTGGSKSSKTYSVNSAVDVRVVGYRVVSVAILFLKAPWPPLVAAADASVEAAVEIGTSSVLPGSDVPKDQRGQPLGSDSEGGSSRPPDPNRTFLGDRARTIVRAPGRRRAPSRALRRRLAYSDLSSLTSDRKYACDDGRRAIVRSSSPSAAPMAIGFCSYCAALRQNPSVPGAARYSCNSSAARQGFRHIPSVFSATLGSNRTFLADPARFRHQLKSADRHRPIRCGPSV